MASLALKQRFEIGEVSENKRHHVNIIITTASTYQALSKYFTHSDTILDNLI